MSEYELILKGDYVLALDICKEKLEKNQNNEELQCNLAYCYYSIDRIC